MCYQNIFPAPPAVPVVAIALYSFTFEPYTVPIDADGNPLMDTIPLIDSIEVRDTIIVFDPETKKETVQVVVSKQPKPLKPEQPKGSGIDTILIFDMETFKETMIIVNHNLGTRDTIKQD